MTRRMAKQVVRRRVAFVGMFVVSLLGHLAQVRGFVSPVGRPSISHMSRCTSPYTFSSPLLQQTQFRMSVAASVTHVEKAKGPFSGLRNLWRRCSSALHSSGAMCEEILDYLWRDQPAHLRAVIMLSMGFLYLSKYLSVQMPFMMKHLLSSLETLQGTNVPLASAPLTLLFGYSFSRFASVLCTELKTVLFVITSQTAQRKYAKRIFAHLHSLDSSFYLKQPSGEVSQSYMRGVKALQTILFEIVFSVAPIVVELLMTWHMMVKTYGGPVFVLLTMLTFTVYTAFTVWVTEWRVVLRRKLVAVDNARNAHLIDSLLNQENVKLFANENHEVGKFDEYLAQIEANTNKNTESVGILNVGQSLIFSMGFGSILALAMKRIIAGTMTSGDLVALNQILLNLALPFNWIGWTYQEFRQAFVDMQYIRNVLAIRAAVQDTPEAIEMPPKAGGEGKVSFEQVTFTYPETGGTLLHNVSFVVEPGTSLAIVGPSGSGKSTTFKLLTRLYDPTHGRVCIDGVDIRNYTLKSLRSNIGVIPQDTILFDQTVDFNVRYGNFSATTDQVTSALKDSSLESSIKKLDAGIHTRVGERGARLSGGERQRLAIARALLKDPVVMLCDEVTSAVDAFAEAEIMDSLRRATNKRTTITIAHRLSSVIDADRILVMDQGRIIEQGTHESLLANPNSVYAKMWARQSSAPKEAAVSVVPQYTKLAQQEEAYGRLYEGLYDQNDAPGSDVYNVASKVQCLSEHSCPPDTPLRPSPDFNQIDRKLLDRWKQDAIANRNKTQATSKEISNDRV